MIDAVSLTGGFRHGRLSNCQPFTNGDGHGDGTLT